MATRLFNKKFLEKTKNNRGIVDQTQHYNAHTSYSTYHDKRRRFGSIAFGCNAMYGRTIGIHSCIYWMCIFGWDIQSCVNELKQAIKRTHEQSPGERKTKGHQRYRVNDDKNNIYTYCTVYITHGKQASTKRYWKVMLFANGSNCHLCKLSGGRVDVVCCISAYLKRW